MISLRIHTRLVPKWFFLFSLLCGLMACGGAAAPPLSIPAPVTGRITISSPDDQGLVTVIGEEDSVSADALVLVINETQDTVAWRLWNHLVRDAYAQTFPSLCSLVARACGQADSVGAFEIQIAASEDDDMTIVEIDATTGIERSERLNKPVPRNFFVFGLVPIDVAIDSNEGFMYVLADNILDDTANSRIIRVDLSTRARERLPIEGTDPRRILLSSNASNLAILDQGGQFVQIADVAGGSILGSTVVSLPAEPVDAVFDPTGSELWVTVNDATNAIAVVDVVLGDITFILPAPDITGWTHVSSVLSLFSSAADQRIAQLSRFTRIADGANGWGMTIYDVATRNVVEGPTGIAGPTMLTDATFIADNRLLLADFGANVILEYTILPGEDLVSDLPKVTAPGEAVLVSPRQVVMAPGIGPSSAGLAFATVGNGNETRPDTVVTIALDTLEVIDITPVGLSPTHLIWNDDLQELFVVSTVSRSVTRLPLTALLPGNPDLF